MTLDNMTGITEGSYTGFCKSQLITCNFVKACNGVCPFEDALKHADKMQTMNVQLADKSPRTVKLTEDIEITLDEEAYEIGYTHGQMADRPKGEWIPCSERLPSDSDDYLVWLEDESKHYAVIPFDTDAEGFGWWQDYYHPISLGFLDSEFIKAENVTAWQPLPKPYKEDGEE